ncbi:MAG: ATP-dependent DNA helicase RecQ [Bacteroidota bacterium]
MTIHQILTKYWGFSKFRPLQEEIINSVLDGKDTLALLPTGGGKSICFQVPALAKEGVCLVISPLIALMKDQVENLKKRGIPATAVFSGMHKNEIDIALDNCIYGKTKLLYLSPERLCSELVRIRIGKMNVNLIAVDEAHCISQWGYDFRPSYLTIADIRKIQPDVPILGLTATATPNVVKDIQKKLLFEKENLFQKSFERKNLAYVVLTEDDKLKRLLKIVNNVRGSGIIYARNRKKTKEIAVFLKKNPDKTGKGNISADYYHAGLDSNLRSAKQTAWTKNKCRVIVSTNAFGMGIDKPDVRFVVHFNPPDSLEAYFQEAGRAGRDEKKAFAVLLYNDSDRINFKDLIEISFPSLDEIKNTYQALANYFQLAVGSGEGTCFDFDISDFSDQYNLKILNVFNSIKFLEKEGYITTTDALFMPPKIHFTIKKQKLYEFQVTNKNLDSFIKLLLRSYGGTFDDFVKINEAELAKRANITKKEVINLLKTLDKLQVLTYTPQNKFPQIVFAQPRIDTSDLSISRQNYEERKKQAIERMNAVISYASGSNKCRSQVLLAYFGETDSYRCGICDVCIERNKLQLSQLEFDSVLQQVKPILSSEPKTLTELIDSIKETSEDKAIKVIQWLIDNDKIKYNNDDRLVWNK